MNRDRARRVAGIDCGTNSVRLLVADVDDTGELVDVDRRMMVVRLGEGVDRTGRLDPAALTRTLDAIAGYAQVCRELGVVATRFVATSATRDAANREEFTDGVRALLGVEPEVVTGDAEAALSFAGATGDLSRSESPGPWLVADIGGGSTELVLGSDLADGVEVAVAAALSVDVGCVRMTERHLHRDPPSADQIAAAAADVDAGLDRVAERVPLQRTGTLVGVAGTVTTIAAAALDLPAYQPHRIHGAVLDVELALATCDRLLAMPREERAALPYLHPGRVDVIGGGALVLSRLLVRMREVAGLSQLRVSEHDILDGIAVSAARRAVDGPTTAPAAGEGLAR